MTAKYSDNYRTVWWRLQITLKKQGETGTPIFWQPLKLNIMLKKTFYTFLALGIIITIGIVTPGFISADTATETPVETAVETPASFAGTWIAGRVGYDGTKEAGTGSWTVTRYNQGKYTITPSSGKIVSIVVTLTDDMGSNETRYKYLVSYHGDPYSYSDQGTATVHIYDPYDQSYGEGNPHSFSFVAYVE